MVNLTQINMDPKKEVMKGIIDLMRHKMFYGHILQQLTKVWDTKTLPIDTMAVGKRKGELLVKLYINSNFVKHLWEVATNKEVAWNYLLGALEHEVLHLVFDHLTIAFSDKIRGAVAVDLVVNSCVEESKMLKEYPKPAHYGFEPHKSAMWYYTHLRDNEKFKNQVKSGAFGSPGLYGFSVKPGDKPGDKPGQGKGGKPQPGNIGSHEMWNEAMNDPVFREFCRDIIRKAKDLCGKNYGNIPGEVIEQIDDLMQTRKAIVPWNQVLRTFAASATESNLSYTMSRTSKRFGTRPGTRKEDVLNLAVAVDTSGSISDRQIVMFFNEIKWIWKNGAIITVFEADTDICRRYQFKGKFSGTIHGRGGTDLEPVLKEVVRKFDALIYFTDFYAPKIETRYNIPILWVLTTDYNREDFPYQWGRFIKIEDGKAERA